VRGRAVKVTDLHGPAFQGFALQVCYQGLNYSIFEKSGLKLMVGALQQVWWVVSGDGGWC
jgi:hypothetical protein